MSDALRAALDAVAAEPPKHDFYGAYRSLLLEFTEAVDLIRGAQTLLEQGPMSDPRMLEQWRSRVKFLLSRAEGRRQ